MSNVESEPLEVHCAELRPDPGSHAAVEVITSREVPLGGPRAMMVRRTLPQRRRSLIGAWCFADHYDPENVADTGGMEVAPHPHTGLQTVSWLFTGEIEHRDSLGKHAMVRPGELNLMTGGRGICHSEVDAGMEHGLLVDAGPVQLCGTELARGDLGYLRPGRAALTIHNPGRAPARMILLGGEPFGEEIVMWWNFVGRSHEDIEAARAEWQERTSRFGHVEGYTPPRAGAPEWLPAPPLPNARMTPRRNPS